MNSFLVSVAAIASLLALPSFAALTNVSPTGYLVSHTAILKAPPRHVFAAIQQVGKWWSAQHTYSGNAGSMSLDMRAGGCLCERWDNNSVQHARVIYVARDKALRLEGGLGPLQEMAVTAIMQFSLEAAGDNTNLTFTYRVRGADAALDKTAASVDRVLAEQIARLTRFVDTGSADPIKPVAALQDQFFDSNGVRIRYVEQGSGADPVILVHDLGSSIEPQWIDNRIVAGLQRPATFRVVALDLRGHGKSDKPAGELVGKEMAADVLRLMAHLGITRAHIVGYGLGAGIATYLAATNPERFATVTIAGGAQVKPGTPGGQGELAVTDEQARSVTVPALGLIGTADPALTDLLALKRVMPRLVRMVSLEGETHATAPRNNEFLVAIEYFLRYHPIDAK